jgi:hypothetical protein
MALTRTIVADGEQITNTERVVNFALTTQAARAFLPLIGDGSGATVPIDYTISVFNTGTGVLTLVTADGHQITTVAPGESKTLVSSNAVAGTTTPVGWVVLPHPKVLQSAASMESTGAGSAALGANCPAGTLTAPYKWLKVIFSDGNVGYIPAFK